MPEIVEYQRALANDDSFDPIPLRRELEIELRDAAKQSPSPESLEPFYGRLARLSREEYKSIRLLVKKLFRVKVTDIDAEVNLRKPKVVIEDAIETEGRQIYEIADAAMERLRQQYDPPQLFVRGGEMVEIRMTESYEARIRVVTTDSLHTRIDRSGRFVQNGSHIVSPRREIATSILSSPCETWDIPALAAIAQTPVFRLDGSLLDTAGYDEISKIFYHPHPTLIGMKPIPEDPCSEEVQEAVDLLNSVTEDFPFDNAASRTNFLGLLLSPIVRPAYIGATPMCLIDAPSQGTGKTLLCELFGIIATGENIAMNKLSANTEEQMKTITSLVLEGAPIIYFDNVSITLRSSELAMAITSDKFRARILQQTKTFEAPQRAIWVASGNNIRLGEEMQRRCYQIRLDAKKPDPHVGRTFRHADIKAYVRNHRAEIVRALLIMARAWFAAGRPSCPNLQKLGGFEGWHAMIAGILHHAGVPHFLEGLSEFQKSADDESGAWAIFLETLYPVFKNKSFTLSDVKHWIVCNRDEIEMPERLATSKNLSIDLGYEMRRIRQKRFGEKILFIDQVPGEKGHGNVAKWKIHSGLDE